MTIAILSVFLIYHLFLFIYLFIHINFKHKIFLEITAKNDLSEVKPLHFHFLCGQCNFIGSDTNSSAFGLESLGDCLDYHLRSMGKGDGLFTAIS